MLPISRRTLFKNSLAVLGMAALNPTRLVHAGLFGDLFGGKGQETLPITPNGEFYITSYDITPSVDPEQWSVKIGGLVRNPLTLTYEDLLKRPQTTMISTLECIGNPVGGYSIGTAEWEGVRLNSVLDEAGIDPKAVDLVLRAAEDYSDSIPVSRALRDEVLLATKMNGVPLPLDHGFPARVIVPGIYGMKNVKWLTGLELVNHDYEGYWQQRNWPDDAFVKLSSRIDLPGDRETIRGRQYRVKGIAFGGLEIIQQVQISTDEGKTWKAATLEPPLSPYAWTHWYHDWAIKQPGEYTLAVRATGATGRAQATQFGVVTPKETVDLHAVTVEVRKG